MKTLLAAFGFLVLMLALMGSFGVGHFRLYFGDDPHGCAKMESDTNTKGQP